MAIAVQAEGKAQVGSSWSVQQEIGSLQENEQERRLSDEIRDITGGQMMITQARLQAASSTASLDWCED